jgi:hypothetical protein
VKVLCSEGLAKPHWPLVNPEKTRLIEFGRYAADNRKRRGLGKPETLHSYAVVESCSYFLPRRLHGSAKRAGGGDEAIQSSARRNGLLDSLAMTVNSTGHRAAHPCFAQRLSRHD